MSFKIQAEVSIKTFYTLMFNGFYQEVKHLTVKFDHLSEGSHEKDKFIDNQREKHNQNLSVDCLLILLRLSKCLSRYHLSLTLSNVILFTQGGVKNDFLLLEESCDSLVDHTDVKVVPEPNSVGSYHQ